MLRHASLNSLNYDSSKSSKRIHCLIISIMVLNLRFGVLSSNRAKLASIKISFNVMPPPITSAKFTLPNSPNYELVRTRNMKKKYIERLIHNLINFYDF